MFTNPEIEMQTGLSDKDLEILPGGSHRLVHRNSYNAESIAKNEKIAKREIPYPKFPDECLYPLSKFNVGEKFLLSATIKKRYRMLGPEGVYVVINTAGNNFPRDYKNAVLTKHLKSDALYYFKDTTMKVYAINETEKPVSETLKERIKRRLPGKAVISKFWKPTQCLGCYWARMGITALAGALFGYGVFAAIVLIFIYYMVRKNPNSIKSTT